MFTAGSLPTGVSGIRKTLTDGLKRGQSIITELNHRFTFEQFRALFLTSDSDRLCLFAAFDRYVADLEQSKRIGTAISYKCARNALREFNGNLKLPDITPALLFRFEEFMLAKHRSITTVGLYARSLRAVYNRAIDDGLIGAESYPFGPKRRRKYEIPQGLNIKKAIDVETIHKIIAFTPKSDAMRFARDM